jgi:hypothetical protein
MGRLCLVTAHSPYLICTFIFYKVSLCSKFLTVFLFIFLGLQSMFCTAGCAAVQLLLKDMTTV